RKGLSATINILRVALYDLFGADGECLTVLQDGCFEYFDRGGESVRGPVSLLRLHHQPRSSLLAYHFFYVAFYSMWALFAHPRPIPAPRTSGESHMNGTAHVTGNVMLADALMQLWTARVVFGPLLWTEICWW
ncbi:squalene epoxidase-domain-containing protein, partial [Suillus ampliporus]